MIFLELSGANGLSSSSIQQMGVSMGFKSLVMAWTRGFDAETDRLNQEATKLRKLNHLHSNEIDLLRAEAITLRKQRLKLGASETKPASQERTLTFRFAKDLLDLQAKIRTLDDPASQELGRAAIHRVFVPLAKNPNDASFLELHFGPGSNFH